MSGFFGFSGAGESDPTGSVSPASITAAMIAIMPNAQESDIADFGPEIASAMVNYEINTAERQAAFLAQTAEESNELWHLRDHYKTRRGEEYADGSAYEGRADLGNDEEGDGPLYKGRGLIQLTGKANYKDVGDALGIDLVSNPELLNDPHWSALAAARYWQSHGCNELADVGNFVSITRRINGGTNGLAQREAYLEIAKEALGIQEVAA